MKQMKYRVLYGAGCIGLLSYVYKVYFLTIHIAI